MIRRATSALILVAGVIALPMSAAAQATKPAAKVAPVLVAKWPDRAIRHDIPLTNMIKRAFAAGTRGVARPYVRFRRRPTLT